MERRDLSKPDIRQLLLFIATMMAYPCLSQQRETTSDSIAVVKTIDGFVEAFTTLDWPKFSACFEQDATAFFPPSAKTPARANNKGEIEQVFRSVFENARKGKSGPPYLEIQPKDVRVQLMTSIAIVTFHLNDPGFFGRRTVVLRKNKSGKWGIIHLHASAIADNTR